MLLFVAWYLHCEDDVPSLPVEPLASLFSYFLLAVVAVASSVASSFEESIADLADL